MQPVHIPNLAGSGNKINHLAQAVVFVNDIEIESYAGRVKYC
jgi:hypothetical protein